MPGHAAPVCELEDRADRRYLAEFIIPPDSACFATPIGYQTNLLVYGPGGYRFSDYLKLGIPFNLVVLLMGFLFIPVFWPF